MSKADGLALLWSMCSVYGQLAGAERRQEKECKLRRKKLVTIQHFMPWERPVSTKAEGRQASPRSLKSACCGGDIREETEDLVVLRDWWWPYREVMVSCSPIKDCPWSAGRDGSGRAGGKGSRVISERRDFFCDCEMEAGEMLVPHPKI